MLIEDSTFVRLNIQTMTNSQQKLFREILDLNWDLNQETNVIQQWEMAMRLSDLKKQLRDDMGVEEYDRFIENGRKMFAPASNP
jgi:hypothetical protein